MILPENTFNHLAQRITSDEIKKANIEGLETCPFCGFAYILSELDKIIKCTNTECLIESCRECRHKSHIPLRCSEIEYDEDVKRRTYIENKMTEALTRYVVFISFSTFDNLFNATPYFFNFLRGRFNGFLLFKSYFMYIVELKVEQKIWVPSVVCSYIRNHNSKRGSLNRSYMCLGKIITPKMANYLNMRHDK